MRTNLSSAPKLSLAIVVVLALVTFVSLMSALAFSTTPPSSATTLTIAFDFDTGLPPLSEGENTPLNQTTGGVTAHFGSPSDPAAFSVQTDSTAFFKLSQFSGKYLYDNRLSRDSLDIRFNQNLTQINFTFATAEYHGGPSGEPSNITLTAYVNSAGTAPIGSAIARGTWPSGDTWPQGTLSFDSGGQPFNLVRIGIPYQGPNGATDFFVDNVIVTTSGPIADTTPPTTVDDYDRLWHCTDFQIALISTDDFSGVAETFYRINSGSVKNVTAQGHPFITTEGANNTLEYWSVDSAGNEEPHNLLTGIRLDKATPTIGTPICTPNDTVLSNQEVKVSAILTDTTSGVKNGTLYYSSDNGTTWVPPLTMTYNASTSFYEAIIPPQTAGTWIKYKIITFDMAGNQAVNDNAGQFYAYQVVPEFPSAMILSLSIVATTLAIFIVRRKFPRTLR